MLRVEARGSEKGIGGGIAPRSCYPQAPEIQVLLVVSSILASPSIFPVAAAFTAIVALTTFVPTPTVPTPT